MVGTWPLAQVGAAVVQVTVPPHVTATHWLVDGSHTWPVPQSLLFVQPGSHDDRFESQ
jgi:hypothetical protein